MNCVLCSNVRTLKLADISGACPGAAPVETLRTGYVRLAMWQQGVLQRRRVVRTEFSHVDIVNKGDGSGVAWNLWCQYLPNFAPKIECLVLHSGVLATHVAALFADQRLMSLLKVGS